MILLLAVDTCIIDLHYRFLDDSHSMDAILQNKCELYFLRLIENVATTCGAKISIEIEPKIEGGLVNRYRLKVVQRKKKKKGKLPEAVKIALLISIFNAPIDIFVNGINKYVENIITNKTNDSVTDDLEKEKLKLEIEKLHLDIESRMNNDIDEVVGSIQTYEAESDVNKAIEDFRIYLIRVNNKKSANKLRLNFYKSLSRLDKIHSVSTRLLDSTNIPLTPEFIVEKEQFVVLGNSAIKQLEKLRNLSDSLLSVNRSLHKAIEDSGKKLNSPDKEDTSSQ